MAKANVVEDEKRMSRESGLAQAVICQRKAREALREFEFWNDLADKHFSEHNGFLQELADRHGDIADPVDWIGRGRVLGRIEGRLSDVRGSCRRNEVMA